MKISSVFLCSGKVWRTLWWPRFADLDPWHGPTPLIKPSCGGDSHTKQRKDWHKCQLRASIPPEKEEDWQQMLAQGQSPSPNK